MHIEEGTKIVYCRVTGCQSKSADRVLLANGGATALLQKDATETGFAVGSGLEQYFGHSLSAKVEYQHIDLGSERLTGVSTNGLFLESTRIDNNFHTIRLGLTYHFHDDYARRDYVPLK